MMILALFIALAALMALVFFGLSVPVIEVVGRLWPMKSKNRLDRVIMIAGVGQTRRQKAAKKFWRPFVRVLLSGRGGRARSPTNLTCYLA